MKLFITGIDTDIGKTFVSAALLNNIKKLNPELDIAVRKPVASGCLAQNKSLVCSDVEILRKASRTTEPKEKICPYSFEAAISPERAIRIANKEIYIKDLYMACESQSEFTLVEGAGGFYSPLALDGNNADLAQLLNYPVILVVGNKLGCINHFQMTQELILARSLNLLAVIVNDISETADIENYHDIRALSQAPCFHIPYATHYDQIDLSQLLKELRFKALLSN